MLSDYPVIDGWTLRRSLRCELTMESLAIEQFEALRRSGNYRMKVWAFPRDPQSEQIPANNSLETKLRVGTGAVIWGYQITKPNGNLPGPSGYQVTEVCTGEPLFSEPPFLDSNFWAGNVPATFGIQTVLLPRLLVVGAPGDLYLELMSKQVEPLGAQIVLFGGQPYTEDKE